MYSFNDTQVNSPQLLTRVEMGVFEDHGAPISVVLDDDVLALAGVWVLLQSVVAVVQADGIDVDDFTDE